ncbi:hypothetical protein VOLCADRAFT_103632 [Volvox carteri f. nagariensis]|uniref:Uncharacterized protein n=1 Tax=Volvox carteri f. nagariensis TaxID=3068 RepID=D8TNI4_VOLCA|nr:uncharacterized protein VOLCADRAFT_103632 [Volvox carteri f. nagariensis]EFJ50999.1 hypothetical protein VOLCADRAFT_103632 [Volvox carteri f. nagariensis]|eukprot:XP_002948011.1 hypothetical protein VOLCADRAFT_103632 [Volvox carteri f. nagariensis]
MIRFGTAATNVLASRAGPAAVVSVLPATAVTAFASRHGARIQPSRCNGCPRCNSAACAAIAPQTCTSSSNDSCSSRSNNVAATHNSSRRLRGMCVPVREPLHRGAVLAATATSVPTSSHDQPPTSGSAPAICDPSAYQTLSLLILLYECTLRAYGSPLLEAADLLTLPAVVDELPCCVVLLVPLEEQPRRRPPMAAAAPISASGPHTPGSTSAAAPSASLDGVEGAQGRPTSWGTTSHGSAPAGDDDSRGSCCSSSGEHGGGSSTSGLMEPLAVQYLNRAAAEALGAVCGTGASSSCPGAWELEMADLGAADVIRAMSKSRGPPRKGTSLCADLTLRAAAPAVEAAGPGDLNVGVRGFGGRRTIHCPEALLLPLMSPNGTCAAVAVLFERWEVNDVTGGVVLEGRPLVPEVTPGSQPAGAAAALTQLPERVRAQADEVRGLKSQQGLTNKDPQVVAAVATLQQLKMELDLQQRLHRAFSGEISVLRPLLQQQVLTDG